MYSASPNELGVPGINLVKVHFHSKCTQDIRLKEMSAAASVPGTQGWHRVWLGHHNQANQETPKNMTVLQINFYDDTFNFGRVKVD